MNYIPANPGIYALLVTPDHLGHELYNVVGWRIEDGYQPEPVGAFLGTVATVYPGEDDSAFIQSCAPKIASRSDHHVYFTADYGVVGGIPDKGRHEERIISALSTPEYQLRLIMVTPNIGLTEALTEIGNDILSYLV